MMIVMTMTTTTAVMFHDNGEFTDIDNDYDDKDAIDTYANT